MAFTDEDLKRLKDILAKTIEPNSEDAQDFCRLAVDNCGALLARLEAAEALIADYPQYEPKFEEKRLAWRKACGL